MAEIITEVDANNMNTTPPTSLINSLFLILTYPNKINNIIDSFVKIQKQLSIHRPKLNS